MQKKLQPSAFKAVSILSPRIKLHPCYYNEKASLPRENPKLPQIAVINPRQPTPAAKKESQVPAGESATRTDGARIFSAACRGVYERKHNRRGAGRKPSRRGDSSGRTKAPPLIGGRLQAGLHEQATRTIVAVVGYCQY